MRNYNRFTDNTPVTGNEFFNDDSYGYRQDTISALESYSTGNTNFFNALPNLISDSVNREELVQNLNQSVMESSLFTSEAASRSPFFRNYTDRLNALTENSLGEIASESILGQYSPIQGYAPVFLKKIWAENVYNAALMAEIPSSTIVNFGYEFRYIVDPATGEEYRMPDVHFNDALMTKLRDAATGMNINNEKEISLPMHDVNMLSTDYVVDYVPDMTSKLNQDLGVNKVVCTYKGADVTIPVNFKVDMMVNGFVNCKIRYYEKDADGAIVREVSDVLYGTVDFDKGTVSIATQNGTAAASPETPGSEKLYTKTIHMCGKLSNIDNFRSLDVKRKVERLQFVMPESGPRFNTSIRIEEVKDAMSAGNIDLIADQTDMMSKAVNEFSEFDCRMFLKNSFAQQEAAQCGPYGYEKVVFRAGFDALPYDTYTHNISVYLEDSHLYLDRLIREMADVAMNEKVMFVAITHPSNMRYLTSSVQWVTGEAGNTMEIGGVKLNYNYGVSTAMGYPIHFISTYYRKADEGIQVIMLPATNDFITFKRYVYSIAIDKGYRNNWSPLTPNIMVTQRTGDFEVVPVQGIFELSGGTLFSPTTLKRPDTPVGP